jgi:hypothetical protein
LVSFVSGTYPPTAVIAALIFWFGICVFLVGKDRNVKM